MSHYFEPFSNEEGLHLANASPGQFRWGLFSVPEEIFSRPEEELFKEGADMYGYPYLAGQALSKYLACKNGQVAIEGALYE